MKRQTIANLGTSGVKVELNYAELLVLHELKLQLETIHNDTLIGDRKSVSDEFIIKVCHNAGTFIYKVLGKDVMLLDEAHNSLFKAEEEVEL